MPLKYLAFNDEHVSGLGKLRLAVNVFPMIYVQASAISIYNGRVYALLQLCKRFIDCRTGL
jgi:hypothetical protein